MDKAETRYHPEEYLYSNFYDGDDTEIRHRKERLVKCRATHVCGGGCNIPIKAGDIALLETGFDEDGPVSCYTCIPCLDNWLNIIHQKCATCKNNVFQLCAYESDECFDHADKPLYVDAKGAESAINQPEAIKAEAISGEG